MAQTPKTVRDFQKGVERGIASVNPGAEYTWTFGPNKVTWADGSEGFTGRLLVNAPGYQSREMVATLIGNSLSVK